MAPSESQPFPCDGAPAPGAALSDSERETAIAHAQARLRFARTPEAVRAAWDELAELVRGRSAAQVERMEREKFGRAMSCK
jgi:hypothetical protein